MAAGATSAGGGGGAGTCRVVCCARIRHMPIDPEVQRYIQSNARRFLEDLKELCTFDSISNHGEPALKPCRDWLGHRLGQFTDRVDVLQAGGMPLLLAEVPGAGSRRLLLYTHYDVQPVDPLELWDSYPFQPAERDGRIFARGVCDDKADVMARIHAIETLRSVRGGLPLTLRFVVEGEEEIGSRSFDRIVESHTSRFEADGCLWESDGFNSSGRAEITFGVRGLLYVQLRVRMLDFDQHSSTASIYPSAAMLLVEALHSLRDTEMNVLIDGFYDNIVPPTDADRQMMAGIDPELEQRRRLVGFERLVKSPDPEWMVEQLLWMPTCNIAGITTGYQGPGSKTVLPAEATAKLDFRLIPDMDPDDILFKLRRHLDSHGFQKVEIVVADGERPARSDPDSEIARSVIACQRDLYGHDPIRWPFMAGTGPMHAVANTLGIPTVMPTGAGRPDARVHAPNENIHINDYLNTVALMCGVFESFGSA